MAQGCFRGCSGPLGAVHIGLQTPLAMGLYYCTLCRVSKYIHTNFQLFIFKNEDFIAQWYFQGCLGPLGAVQDPQGQFIRGFRPPWPWDFTLIQFAGYLCASIPAFSFIFEDFMAYQLFRGCVGPPGVVFGGFRAKIFGRLYHMS